MRCLRQAAPRLRNVTRYNRILTQYNGFVTRCNDIVTRYNGFVTRCDVYDKPLRVYAMSPDAMVL
ncbi:hypothetical protein [Nostoc sp. T09]|uniref:hypothetical protein n=1 Tax=Nostoc sp. T09 TaxID=1932621 RepID=UPI00117E1514|nr:hypothetical protein [Nostoc sp. T09]